CARRTRARLPAIICLPGPATSRTRETIFWPSSMPTHPRHPMVISKLPSPSYGHLETTLATDQPTKRVHHTEYIMPASGMLFANDHDAGRTFVFDLRDPLHPKIQTSFTDMDGYMHPHSFLRLPHGHVLATFQHTLHGEMEEEMGGSGG